MNGAGAEGAVHGGIRYRPEIDGLRALAVLPVVLYHAGVPGIGGGYVGVDIFFVISGFLITSTLLADHDRGRYSLRSFYERRIRRILPALLTVLSATLVAGLCLMASIEFEALSKSVLATLGFLSNILFFRQTGYFDLSSEYKPLLHTWSLAVEEQFYIVFPVLLATLVRFARHRIAPCIAVLCIGSFALSIWAGANAPSFNFFLPFTRAWELLIGSILALKLIAPSRDPRIREGISMLGVAAILAPILGYDHNTAFPGWTAVPPVLGAAALIWASAGTRIGALLAARPTVYVGLISYSLYLWHWPVLVFTRFVVLEPLDAWQSAFVVLLPIVLAAATLRFVERPTRDRVRWPVRRLLVVCAAWAGLLGLVAAVGVATRGKAGRPMVPDAWTRGAEAASAAFQGDRCLARDGKLPDDCRIGAAGPRPTVALWGDSHAAHLVPVVESLLDDTGRAAIRLTKAGCPPVAAARFAPRSDFLRECPIFAAAAWQRIASDPGITTVIVAAQWQHFLDGPNMAFGDDAGTTLPDSHRTFAVELARLRDLMRARGGKMVIVGQVPLPLLSPVFCLRSAAFQHQPDATCKVFPAAAPRAVAIRIERAFLGASKEDTIRFVDPTASLCDRRWCHTIARGQLLYMDTDHLMPAGSMALRSQLRRALDP